MTVHDPIIPVDALDEAHRALDTMLEKAVPGRTADTLWISVMTMVEPLEPEQQRQNLALLLTVALQRLSHHAG